VSAAVCCCTFWAALAALVADSPFAWLAQETDTQPAAAGCPAPNLPLSSTCASSHTWAMLPVKCSCQWEPRERCNAACCCHFLSCCCCHPGGCSPPLCLHHEGGVLFLAAPASVQTAVTLVSETAQSPPAARQTPSVIGATHSVGGWFRDGPGPPSTHSRYHGHKQGALPTCKKKPHKHLLTARAHPQGVERETSGSAATPTPTADATNGGIRWV
jgi:hypothetical protein